MVTHNGLHMVHVQRHVEMVYRNEHVLVRNLHQHMVVKNAKEKMRKYEIVNSKNVRVRILSVLN